MSPSLDYPELLRRHNPILVLFPQDPGSRLRPGALRLFTSRLWGDYHPCSAAFFLARVCQRDRPKPYNPLAMLLFFDDDSSATGYDSLQQKVQGRVIAGKQEETGGWELDLAKIPSQSERRAWKVCGTFLKEPQHRYESVVYGRWCEGRSGIALQYWYLYIYNDFSNNHEGDWEMVTIEITNQGQPKRIAVSSHQGGYVLPWDVAPRQGDRPIVRVARGSHGGYFAYQERGHDAVEVVRRLNLPANIRFLQPLFGKLPPLPWMKDHAPADPENPAERGAPRQNMGERRTPELRILPNEPPAIGSPQWADWWWLHYLGKWGSWHTRLMGTIGVDSPWGRTGHTVRWRDPVSWIEEIE